jgi:hypothetical protein
MCKTPLPLYFFERFKKEHFKYFGVSKTEIYHPIYVSGEQLEAPEGETGGEDHGAVQKDGQFYTKEKRYQLHFCLFFYL